MNLKTAPFDAAKYLKTDQDMADYLQAVFEDCQGEPQAIISALGDIARAKGIQALARQTNLSRAHLYTALSPNGNPEFATILKVFWGLGLRLNVQSQGVVLPV